MQSQGCRHTQAGKDLHLSLLAVLCTLRLLPPLAGSPQTCARQRQRNMQKSKPFRLQKGDGEPESLHAKPQLSFILTSLESGCMDEGRQGTEGPGLRPRPSLCGGGTRTARLANVAQEHVRLQGPAQHGQQEASEQHQGPVDAWERVLRDPLQQQCHSCSTQTGLCKCSALDPSHTTPIDSLQLCMHSIQ